MVVAVDGEVSNSTYSDIFKKAFPDRFFEVFIAEQLMVSVACGLQHRRRKPFCSTFAAFYSRAYDQIRMGAISQANMKLCGSHAGVSIGEDGPSQMALEDIAMMRAVWGSTVLYPSDATSTAVLVEQMKDLKGISFIRTTREATPVLYEASEQFPIGGSKTLRQSDNDVATVIGAGITLHEALKAAEQLQGENTNIRVIDLYSVKPIDTATIAKAARETRHIVVVEDHLARRRFGRCGSGRVGRSARRQPARWRCGALHASVRLQDAALRQTDGVAGRQRHLCQRYCRRGEERAVTSPTRD
jgi:transketolase